MKTKTVLSLAGAFIAPALLAAAPAQAQVSGVAVADPEAVVLGAAALNAANTSIATTYAAQLAQVKTRQQQLQAQLQAMAKPLDTNKDGQVSDAEIQAAQTAKNPVLTQIDAAQKSGQEEIQRLNAPMLRAQAYAIEQITQKYNAAMQTVVTSKKISLLLSANTVQFAQPAVDVTDDIKAELDRTTPSVSVAPPANWQASQQTIQLLQQYQQAVYAQAVRQAQAQGQPQPAAPAGAAPAKPGKPVGR